ncbi:MAG: TonB family protein [Nitrospinota bacterium]|nr:TonB family protein [Nitrospinota bacterium]
MSETKKALLVPLFVSLLLHLTFFVGFSLNFLWLKSVSANKPVSVRIVSIDLPKPEENIPTNPDSRFISNANRKESGEGKPADRPKLRREIEERLPAKRGENAPEVATLARPPSAKVLPDPPPPEPTPVEPTPPKPEIVEQPTPEPVKEPKVVEKPEPEPVKPPEPKAVEQPEPEPVKPPEPKVVEKSEPEPVKPPEPKAVEKPEPEPVKKPEPRVVKKAKPIPRKPAPPRKKTVRPKKRPPKRVRVASLPRPRPKPEPQKIQRRPPPPKPAPRPRAKSKPKSKPPADPLAMFRRRPADLGRPDSNRLKLPDEEAERIAKASLEESLREEEGEAVSLDTRNYKYASYFAHIKKRIYEFWHWPPEARKYYAKLKLKFVLRDDGKLHRVELLSSSKYKILDDEALSAIAKAAPFRPFPLAFKRKLLPIEAVFSYERPSGFGYR